MSLSVKCDSCGVVTSEENWQEFQELLRIDYVGGFGSVFGDGARVHTDLCQVCVNALLRPVLIVDQMNDGIEPDSVEEKE